MDRMSLVYSVTTTLSVFCSALPVLCLVARQRTNGDKYLKLLTMKHEVENNYCTRNNHCWDFCFGLFYFPNPQNQIINWFLHRNHVLPWSFAKISFRGYPLISHWYHKTCATDSLVNILICRTVATFSSALAEAKRKKKDWHGALNKSHLLDDHSLPVVNWRL